LLPNFEESANIGAANEAKEIFVKYKLLFGAALCCVLTMAQSGQVFSAIREFQLEDLRSIISLSYPRMSPDGKRIAVVVSTPNWKTNKAQQEIDIFDAANGARRVVTWKRSGISSPKWSEDGSRLAFLAEDFAPAGEVNGAPSANAKGHAGNDSDEKRPQVFIMPMDGGDPIRVTDAAKGVDEFAWSPDGTQLAFITADEPANAQAIKEHDDAFQVTDNHFLTRAALTPWHLWVVPSTGGAAKRLTQGSFSLQTDQRNSAPVPEWSRDGRGIAFTRFPGPYWGPSFRSVIASVETNNGSISTLESATGSEMAAYAPSGDALAYLRPRDGDQNNGNAVYVMMNGGVLDVTRSLARSINTYRWLPDGKGLLLEGFDGTRSALWQQPLQGAAKRLDLGEVEAGADFSVAKNGAVVLIGSTPTRPGELYVMDSLTAKPRRITNLNAFVDGLSLGRTVPIEWRGPQGFAEDGVLTYPVGFQAAQKYPLVLVIHGGPTSTSTVKFSPLPQLLAAAGFIVFQPNYRGSNNLGDAYQHAIFRDTGAGPGKDVMAGIAAVQKLAIVDGNRIGVSGWSYGGYMTAWLTGHYDIWKAAVAGAALTDWVMDYTLAYYQEGDAYLFGGSPWNAKYRNIWRDQSPINYASNVTAPTLIMGDVGDPNVPLLNSYQWYHALRDAGVEVEFFAYPVDTHFPSDVVRTTDVYRRWVSWMIKYLK
jgi:dipeptidyl aminopeptidase/acylaminoacyl peptidase